MKMLAKIFNVIAIVNLLLSCFGMIAYYIIEFISSFFVSTINLVVIGNIFWKTIFICLGGAVCFFVLAYFISKNMHTR